MTSYTILEDIGFTGTQKGMTGKQALTLGLILRGHAGKILHHGDCIGADAQAHKIARICGLLTACHPPIDPKKRAFTTPNDFMYPEKEYLTRNGDICCAKFLVATPGEFIEQLRSGTWATIREARRREKDVHIIWPDGDVDVFTGPYQRRVDMRKRDEI